MAHVLPLVLVAMAVVLEDVLVVEEAVLVVALAHVLVDVLAAALVVVAAAVPDIVLDIVVVHALVAALAVVAAAAHLDVQVVRADVQIPASMAVNGALHKF